MTLHADQHLAPRYRPNLYLGDLAARKYWAERKPSVEIEVLRDVENKMGEAIGRARVKRRGILNRANGQTIFVGVYCYHVDEILAYREIGGGE